MDVRLPDGRIIKNVPEGTTKAQLITKLQSNGIELPDGFAPERSFGEAITDLGASALVGVGGIAALPGQLYGMATGNVDNVSTRAGGKIRDFGEGLKSEELKFKQAQLRAQAEEAAKNGVLDEFLTTAKGTITDPTLLAALVAEFAPSLGYAGLATKGAQAAAKALIPTLAKEGGGKALQKIGVGTAVGSGAVLEGGGAFEETYNEAIKLLADKGVTGPQAEEIALGEARKAGAATTLATGAVGFLPGTTGLERVLAGGRGAGVLKTGAGEVAQGVAEGATTTIPSNLALQSIDPTIDTLRGTGSAAALEAVGGGVAGGALGLVNQGTSETTNTPTGQPTEAERRKQNKIVVEQAAQEKAAVDAAELAARMDAARTEREQAKLQKAEQKSQLGQALTEINETNDANALLTKRNELSGEDTPQAKQSVAAINRRLRAIVEEKVKAPTQEGTVPPVTAGPPPTQQSREAKKAAASAFASPEPQQMEIRETLGLPERPVSEIDDGIAEPVRRSPKGAKQLALPFDVPKRPVDIYREALVEPSKFDAGLDPNEPVSLADIARAVKVDLDERPGRANVLFGKTNLPKLLENFVGKTPTEIAAMEQPKGMPLSDIIYGELTKSARATKPTAPTEVSDARPEPTVEPPVNDQPQTAEPGADAGDVSPDSVQRGDQGSLFEQPATGSVGPSVRDTGDADGRESVQPAALEPEVATEPVRRPSKTNAQPATPQPSVVREPSGREAVDLDDKEVVATLKRVIKEAPKGSPVVEDAQDNLAEFRQLTKKKVATTSDKDRMLKIRDNIQRYVRPGFEKDVPDAAPLYRKEDGTAPRGVPVETVRAIADAFKANAKNTPTIRVAKSSEEVPQAVRDFAGEDIGKVRGFYMPETNEVYVIADNTPDSRDAQITLMHELVGHYGLRAILGNAYARTMKAAKSNAMVGKLLDGRTPTDVNVEEVLAELAEGFVDGTAPKPARPLMRRVIEAMRSALRALGLNIKLTDNEAAGLIADSYAYVFSGKGKDRRTTTGQGVMARSPEQVDTQAFKSWFGDSKVVDAEGKPLVVYHGTDADISAFDVGRSGSNLDSGWLGTGIYLTTDIRTANYYANSGRRGTANVMPLYTSIKNPYLWGLKNKGVRGEVFGIASIPDDIRSAVLARAKFKAADEPDFSVEPLLSNALRDELIERGYDGVIADFKDGALEIVAFNPTQIKSATGNRGTFDSANPDIRFRKAKPETNPDFAADVSAVEEATGRTEPYYPQEKSVIADAKEFWKGGSKIDIVRNKFIDQASSVARKFSDLYSQGFRDSFGNVNPMGLYRQAQAAPQLIQSMLRTGGVRYSAERGQYETTKVILENPTSSLPEGTEVHADMVLIKIKEMANTYGIDAKQAELLVDSTLKGLHVKSLMEKNDGIEQTAQTLETKGKKREANVAREKLVKFTPAEEALVAPAGAYLAKYDEIRQIKDVMNALRFHAIDQAVEAGVLSKEQGKEWKDVMDYVPFDRIRDQDEAQSKRKMTARGLVAFSPLPSLRGSEFREVGNVVNNYFNMLGWMTSQTMRNKAATMVLEDMRLADYAKKVSDPKVADNEAAVVRVFENGENSFYELLDEVDVAAFDALPVIHGPILNALQKSTRLLRTTVTAMPPFAISQVIQDAQRAAVYSGTKHPFKVMGRTLTNFPTFLMYSALGKKHAMVKALEEIGVVGAYDLNVLNPTEESRIDAGLEKLPKWKYVVRALDKITTTSDLAARAAVYQTMIEESGGDKARAAQTARELINFRRRGTSEIVSWGVAAIPFFNAYIQGMDNIYRSINGVDAPSALEKNVARAKFFKAVRGATAIGTAYALMMAGDEEYEEAEDYLKDRAWILPGGVRIPMPAELGTVFKVLPERVIRYIRREGTEEEQRILTATTDYMKSAWAAYSSPNVTPQLARPIVEWVTNYSFFTGRSIVPESLAQKEAFLQVGSNTSEPARIIGNSLGLSPMKVENFLTGVFGMAGSMAMQTGDAMLTNRGDRPLYKMPLLSTFTYDPIGSKPRTEFYALADEIGRVKTTFDDLNKTDPEAAIAYLQKKNHENLYAAAGWREARLEQVSRLRAMRKFIEADKVMSGEDKRQQLDALRVIEQELNADVRAMANYLRAN